MKSKSTPVETGSVPSILDTCQPRPDIRAGSFNPEIFTASLSHVMDWYRDPSTTSPSPYTDAEQFFRDITYPTEGLRMTLSEVFGRLAGDHTVPSIHRLETAFGGGKTHTLIALTHIGFRGRDLADVLDDILDRNLLSPPGEVAVVGVGGEDLPLRQTQGTALTPYTLWGEIAHQIGGEALYRQIEADATSYAAPGRPYFEQVLGQRKVLIMLDELAQYATRLEEARPNGSAQLAAFLMSLHGYARDHPGISVVLTLASNTDAFAHQTRRLIESLSEIRGEAVPEEEAIAIAKGAEQSVRSVVSRDAVTVTPVQATEISRVLAKRLFVSIDTQAAQQTAEAYMAMYRRHDSALPDRAIQESFREELTAHYPFHPTFIDYLNHKLSTVETFQGTRGVLRVLAVAIRRLWSTGRSMPMIHTCHLDLRDARTVNEIVGRTGSSDLLPELNTDVGGPDTANLAVGHSRAELADRRNPHPKNFPWHEYAWKTVFLHSLVGRAEGLGSNVFGITEREALFEVAFPDMPPTQVETALQAIEGMDGAYYLRCKDGRYYASREPSINRALDDIRTALHAEQVEELLAATARKVVRAEAGTFDVVHDVAAPEHVRDKSHQPILALVALDADHIDAAAMVTTTGPNRPRLHQNFVFLLVPELVHVEGEVWSEDRVKRMHEVRRRLDTVAREVLARQRLKAQPENYGLTTAMLAEKTFDASLKERELALETVVTQTYNAVWFPSAAGRIHRKEIKTAGGESGASVIEEIRRLLLDEGELITADQARTQETLLGLTRLFFEATPTPAIAALREQFACNRHWPVLEQPALLEHIVREGVSHGVWCLFRMENAERTTPSDFFSRDTDPPFLDLDLGEAGWSLVTVQGAKQRGWTGPEQVDLSKLERWVASTIAEEGATYVTQLMQKITEQHGEVPEDAVLNVVENLRQADRLMTYSGQPEQQEAPADLRHGAGTMAHAVQPDDVIIAPAVAAKRGWVSNPRRTFSLEGRPGAQALLPLLSRLGSFYTRGAHSPIKLLDLVNLEVRGGGRLRLVLEDISPEAMKQLGELFETLVIVVDGGDDTEACLDIDEPDEQCALIQALKQERNP